MNPETKNGRSGWPQKSSAARLMLDRSEPPWRLVLLGAPGVGKGTQAPLLSERLGACHLSTGEIFRAAQERSEYEQSTAMRAALESMRRGELAPDPTVCGLVSERLSSLRNGGFLLDGFPRTLGQAESLTDLLESRGLSLDAVVNYELPQTGLIARLSGRRICRQCQAVFNLATQPPRAKGICDRCGGPLDQRHDDRPEAIAVRMESYRRITAPLIRFYSDLGLLLPIAASGSPNSICARTVAALRERRVVRIQPSPPTGRHSASASGIDTA
jgi:adenylate kinase